jgi:hypothetical protein
MNRCLSIRLKNKPSYEYCQSYRVTANEDGTGAGVMTLLCGGAITQSVWIPAGEERVVCAAFGEVPTKTNGTSSIQALLIGVCTDENSAAQDDPVYFDLPVGFSLRETKRLTELTEVQTLKFTYSLGFDMPPTKKNLDLIKTQFNPNVLDNNYAELEVEVTAGSHIISDAQLYVSKCTEDKITAELRLSVNHWARLAKSLLLRDLPYAEVTYGCALVTDVIVNQYPYQLSSNFNDPANLGIWFPYVDYSRMVRDTTTPGRNNDWLLPVCYARPWYYVTGLLQRGFCALGWGFTSPLFESEIGRKLITYIMDKGYGLSGQVYEQRRNNLNTKANTVGDAVITLQYGNVIGSIWWPNITEDAVGNLDPNTGFYSACGQVNVRGKVTIGGVTNSSRVELHIGRLRPQAGFGAGQGSFSFSPLLSREFTDPSDDIEWEFELENISISSEEQLGVIVERAGTGLLLLRDESYIEFEGVRPYPSEGDAESLQNMIDGDYTFLDLLKGVAHQFNLKIKTDFSNRTVELYQPYRADMWGEDIEGYYIEETIENIDAKLNPKSKEVTLPDTEQPRFLTLKYADTTDKGIDEMELKNPLWSRVVDLGEKFTVKESKDIENPFFEPTLNRSARFSNSFGIHIPTIAGEGEYTFDVGPRIAIAFGHVIQELDNVNNPRLRLCTFAAAQSELIPTASMFAPVKLGVTHNDANSVAEFPLANLAYGINSEVSTIEPEATLYDIVYRRWLLEQINNLKIEYLLDISTYDYSRFDFRGVYRFSHMGRPIVARMQEIKDYRYCQKLQTPIVFIPERQLSDVCLLLPPGGGGDGDGANCENNPVIIVNQVSQSNYLFLIGGQNNSPISSAVFEYSTDGGTVWQLVPPVTPFTAQLSPIIVDFLVRATVNYAVVQGVACPSILLPPKPVTPCPVFNYELICENVTIYDPNSPNEAVGAVRVSTELPLGQNVIVVSSQYRIGGGQVQNYPVSIVNNLLQGVSIAGGPTVQFLITLRTPPCPAISLSITCNVIEPPTPAIDCDQIKMDLFCVEDSPGCWVFSRSGLLFGENDNYIKYQCSVDGVTYGPWLLWDEVTPICCNYIRARWWAVFCDDQCPTKCSPVISCETNCQPFEYGTIVDPALCN